MTKYTNGLLVIDAEQFDPKSPKFKELGITEWTAEFQPNDGSWGYIGDSPYGMASHVHSGDWIITYAGGSRIVKTDKAWQWMRNVIGGFVPLTGRVV